MKLNEENIKKTKLIFFEYLNYFLKYLYLFCFFRMYFKFIIKKKEKSKGEYFSYKLNKKYEKYDFINPISQKNKKSIYDNYLEKENHYIREDGLPNFPNYLIM
jgi:hypothetical protein